MSMLMDYTDPLLLEAAQKIFEEHFRRDPELEKEMDIRRRKLMYDDIIYNFSYLLTAVHFKDGKIFENYARWLYELLCGLMKDLDRDRIARQMTDHYTILSEQIAALPPHILSEENLSDARSYLQRAILITRDAVTDVPFTTSFEQGPYAAHRKEYLEALLKSETGQAHQIIENIRRSDSSLPQIYEEILAPVMREVGELWHQNRITVDKEHYITSVTQSVLSRFYDELFYRPRIGRTLVSCAVGSELHEIGTRMLSDIFEYYGWDTYYLGAALPRAALLKALSEYKPDLVALTVTMPPHLSECEETIQAIRGQFPDMRIIVGGQAFASTEALWEKWDVDHYAPTYSGIIRWAQSVYGEQH